MPSSPRFVEVSQPRGWKCPQGWGSWARGGSPCLHSHDFGDIELVLVAAGIEGKNCVFQCLHLRQVRRVPGGTHDVDPVSQELWRGREQGRVEGLFWLHPWGLCKEKQNLCPSVPWPRAPLGHDRSGLGEGLLVLSPPRCGDAPAPGAGSVFLRWRPSCPVPGSHRFPPIEHPQGTKSCLCSEGFCGWRLVTWVPIT